MSARAATMRCAYCRGNARNSRRRASAFPISKPWGGLPAVGALSTARRAQCRFGKIVAIKQQRQASAFRQSIGKEVAVIQRRRMPSLAKTPPRGAGDLGLVLINRDDLDAGAVEQQIELAAADLPLAAFDHDRGFQQRSAAESRRCGLASIAWAKREDGNQRRAVDDYQRGSPCSS